MRRRWQKKSLSQSPGKVSLIVDCWTTRSGKCFHAEKLQAITSDNALNMEKMFEELQKTLKDRGLKFNPKDQRIRCFAHITLLSRIFLEYHDYAPWTPSFWEQLQEVVETETRGALDIALGNLSPIWDNVLELITTVQEWRNGEINLDNSRKLLKELLSDLDTNTLMSLPRKQVTEFMNWLDNYVLHLP
ncbi:unnamed protein product [Allacma fusca]|uniref:Uncharacterized protein n=1 Tax=Allacma fusca TaxID=39272 RepID=A0A8J2NW87_9HEXA|nr:unnamed protein product [Allacma fusca]